MMGDAFQQFGCFRADITLRALLANARLKVPVAAPIGGFGSEGALLGEGLIERRFGAALKQFGISGLHNEGRRWHAFLVLYAVCELSITRINRLSSQDTQIAK